MEDTKNFYFLILQYNKVDLTRKCISSILRMESQNKIGIVVVDNDSPDGAGKSIIEDFLMDSDTIFLQKTEYLGMVVYSFRRLLGCKIDILLRGSNDGFSKGNNDGYRYIIEKYKPAYLTVANNDVEFTQSDYISLIETEYQETEFDILGPDIWAPIQSIHQNPMSSTVPTLIAVNKTILLNQIALMFFPIIYPILKRFVGGSHPQSNGYDKRTENICLQGSCLIYSEKYIRTRRSVALLEEKNIQIGNTLFYPETNLYYEEFIQTLWCKKNNCKMLYAPEIRVNHMEGQSTDTIAKEEKERVRFRIRNILAAAKIYRRQLLNDKNVV